MHLLLLLVPPCQAVLRGEILFVTEIKKLRHIRETLTAFITALINLNPVLPESTAVSDYLIHGISLLVHSDEKIQAEYTACEKSVRHCPGALEI